MKDDQASTNVIQFPGNKKKVEEPKAPKPMAQPAAPVKPSPKGGGSGKTVAGAVIAVMLFSGAVNRYAFNAKSESMNLSSTSSDLGRVIASVERVTWQRDANWEKNLAESLASSQLRTVASSGVGHNASAEENLRYGTLEEKYNIQFRADAHKIDSITLQEKASNPAYVLDRAQFLKEYGVLLQEGYASAQLKSSEVGNDKTVEAYTLFDSEKREKAVAHFELDSQKRLLSLKIKAI